MMTLSQSGAGSEDFFTADFDQRLAFQRRADRRGKSIAVDRERPAGGQLVVIRRAHDERGKPPHLGMEETDGASLRIVGPERVGTNELGKSGRLVYGGRANRPHFMQDHGHAPARDLPGRLGTGKAAADHMDGSQ